MELGGIEVRGGVELTVGDDHDTDETGDDEETNESGLAWQHALVEKENLVRV